MKLDELIPQNKTYEELQDLFLVFDAQFLPQLIHAQNDQPNHIAQPIPLNNGRYVLSADILTEIGEKGIYRAAFARLNKGNFKFVDVLTASELDPLKIVDLNE
jgi:hypothetical protein